MARGEGRRAGRFSIAHLRRWLLAGVLLLLAVLAGLVGYARYRARRLLADLPHRLGLDIKSETNDFTISQSVKGHTLFTLHAAKAIQHENGKTILHNVAVTVYGPQGSNRTDSIRGDEFEYDQPNGVVRAAGIVHLDLAAPAQPGVAEKGAARRMQVTTSGLVLLQRLGVAATDDPIQIVYGDLHGGATGADYESDTGILRLRSNVHMDGVQDGRPLHVDAGAAELDRNTLLADLTAAHLESGAGSASGDHIQLTLAKDGGVREVNGSGHVVLRQGNATHAESPRMHALLSSEGKLVTVRMDGGVAFADGATKGSAANGVLRFDAAGQPSNVDLAGAVHMEEGGTSSVPQRVLSADHATAALQQGTGKRVELRDATATGNATLRSVDALETSGPGREHRVTRITTLSAATLHAVTAVAPSGRRFLATVNGTGGTRLQQSDTAGNSRTSTGDALTITLRPPRSGGAVRDVSQETAGSIQTAVQTGGVTVTQHTALARGKASGASPAEDSTARAARAEFDGATDRLVLTGSPVVTSPGVQVSAERITLAQSRGDAEAEGSVKGTFVQEAGASASADPVHVFADRALLSQSGSRAQFFGAAQPVHLWNTASQMDAPEVDLDRTAGTLQAHGAAGAVGTVHLLLTPTVTPGGKSRESGPVRIAGESVTMTGATAAAPGRIDVNRAVRVVSAASDLQADHVLALVRSSGKGAIGPAAAAGPFAGGSIESIVATGDVRLRQPGRSGAGTRLVYTAADGRYELTGAPGALPTMTDSLRGTVTGTSLIFHTGDDSVEVAGEQGRRVRTETHAARPSRSR